MQNKNYEELTFTDAFLFAKIMYNSPELCKDLLELILGKKIDRIVFTDYEKTIAMRPDSKSIRLDVYTMDEEQRVYDIEMQVENEKDLPKRTRYYQSMISLEHLEKGNDYSQLNDSYVIFICKEKPRKDMKKAVYTFRYQSREDPETYLEDGTWNVLVNASCDKKGLNPELADFLTFIKTGETASADGIAFRLKEAVAKALENAQWKVDYMRYQLDMEQKYREGLEAGRAEGRAEGLAEGIAQEQENTEAALRRAEAAEKELVIALAEIERLKGGQGK